MTANAKREAVATPGRSARNLLAATLAVLSLAALSGCASSPPSVAPGPSASASVCARVPWPATVGELTRVDTSPQAPWAAAWGSPAVIARCGMAAMTPTRLDCVSVDGVDWVVEKLSDGVRLTTYGRDPALEVLVPTAHGPGPLLLPAFDAAARAMPSNGHQCS